MSDFDVLKGIVNATDPQLSDAEIQLALDGSLIPDLDGHYPGETDYVDTHDINWAAAYCMDLKGIKSAAEGNLESFTSEGSSFKILATDWAALAKAYRDKSIIQAALDNKGFTILDVNAHHRYRPTSRGLYNELC